MIAQIAIDDSLTIQVDLSEPIDISIPINEGNKNPNCYWAEEVKFETIRLDGFVGSVAEGGSVNYQKLTLTPHGNGTHVECYGHITDSGATVQSQLKQFYFYAKLVTLSPEQTSTGDWVIQMNDTLRRIEWKNIKALIIRTHPNDKSKLEHLYSGTNPPYLSEELVHFVVEQGIEHLLVDLPSLDREVDEGALVAHRAFWGIPDEIRENATITELIFVPDHIPDANYLLNLQSISLEMDAAPCKPLLFSVQKIPFPNR